MMKHLFSPEGELAVARVLSHRPLLAFDFDGTLTPIVARPEDARLSSAVASRLAALSAQLPVAIVTGRSVADVRTRLNFTPQFVVGNHGAEEEALPPAQGAAEAATCAALESLRQRLSAAGPELQAAGVWVEDKGHSLALHYRLARDPALAQRFIEDLLADPDEALRVFGGKRVVNVAPRHAPDKAEAVRRLAQRCGASHAVFAGDDLNDEPVFAAAPPEWLTVRVGRDDRQSQARFFLDSPREVTLLLDRMIALLAGRR